MGLIKSPLPGKVIEYTVKEGDLISKGTVVAIVESMKMLNEICSEEKCLVKKLIAPVDEYVPVGGDLVEIFYTDA